MDSSNFLAAMTTCLQSCINDHLNGSWTSGNPSANNLDTCFPSSGVINRILFPARPALPARPLLWTKESCGEGKLKVHHSVNLRQIYASANNIRGKHHIHASLGESLDGLQTSSAAASEHARNARNVQQMSIMDQVS